MDALEMQTDDPQDMSDRLAEAATGDRVVIHIPVTVSAQDSRTVADSIRSGTFVAEGLVACLGLATVAIDDASSPNEELIRLEGVIKDCRGLRDFVDEWFDTLDPDGSREPFEFTSDAASRLYERLDSEESSRGFPLPVLVNWYRAVRSHFDEWDVDDV